MSKRQNARPETKKAGRPSPKGGYLFVAVFVGVLALVALVWWWNNDRAGTAESVAEPAPTNAVAASSEPRPVYQRLLGQWVRPDGGYVLEIKSADDTGKLDAGYFNPNPIHVARAEASGQGSMIKVFIELRDVNYPGATYTLAYDPAGDQLKGVYYQPLAEAHYEIFFERMK